jgi:hypothetical protein
MYRYGKWDVDATKWKVTAIHTERVEADGKGGWKVVLSGGRTYMFTEGATPVASGTYGAVPGQPLPPGFTVDSLTNTSGTKTYWRARLEAVDRTQPAGIPKIVATSAVQELTIP